jgi:hypothetical protein
MREGVQIGDRWEWVQVDSVYIIEVAIPPVTGIEMLSHASSSGGRENGWCHDSEAARSNQ